jgi:SAM-dependent methyltransferase
MRSMFTALQYYLLTKIAPAEPQTMNGSAYAGRSKLCTSLGDQLLDLIRDKTVIDFGCGEGDQCLELVRCGARKVIGIDIRDNLLQQAAEKARAAGLDGRCEFRNSTDAKADVIISLDSFEHFEDPAAVLDAMYDLLKPGGQALISFGPTWYHPLGGHLFSVFPWAHLVFSEQALIRWRSRIRHDGATRFAEVEGGLNQMTVAAFEKMTRASQFSVEMTETVPIRKLRRLHSRITREFTTAVVRARLQKPAYGRPELVLKQAGPTTAEIARQSPPGLAG